MEGAKVDEEKSETYSTNMTEAMGAGKFICAATSSFRLWVSFGCIFGGNTITAIIDA